jgi:peroxiredoxin Q/BCP
MRGDAGSINVATCAPRVFIQSSPAMKPAIVTSLGMLLVSCATSTPPSPSASAPAAAPSSAAVAPPAPSATPAAAAADDLVGKPAPDFTAAAQDGTPVHLAALKGKMVVLYFYPKDETPGCTKEACSFRDSWDAIAKTGAVLVGISADTLDSHKSFAAHYHLPFLLVSDPDGSVGRSYSVPFQGRHHRETFVIGSDGNVRKAYRQVDVTMHAQQILADLTAKQ